jgi:hypothetical protein
MRRGDTRDTTGSARPALAATITRPSRALTIVGQDPFVRHRNGRIVTAVVSIPNEPLGAGPRGHRVQIVDYDASHGRHYVPFSPDTYGTTADPADPLAVLVDLPPKQFNTRVLNDPRLHAHNVYAIAMRTLSHFERALGRRVNWSFGGHQLKVAPHAFAEPNASYSRQNEGILFGYFVGAHGLVFTSLSHDIIAHETTHALIDGLRPHLMEPSSPEQAAFHEAFGDIVALLSVFSLPEIVTAAVRHATDASDGRAIAVTQVLDRLKDSVLFGLGEQFGDALSSQVHGASLRRSVRLAPDTRWRHRREFQEEHTLGEILVAAVLHTFLDIYRRRLTTLGRDSHGVLPARRVAEEGADIAQRLLTMAIRSLDYLPPTDVEFGDFLSALITSDLEIRPDDSRFHARDALRRAFRSFGIVPASTYYQDEEGRWAPPLALKGRKGRRPRLAALNFSCVHREALQRDTDEVFRFLWHNRRELRLCEPAYTVVNAVRPCLRVDEDGVTLRETVADYVQILTIRAGELKHLEIPGMRARIAKPAGLRDSTTIRLLGGGALIFDEFGSLKYHVSNAVLNAKRQTARLAHLFRAGFLDRAGRRDRSFAAMHLQGLRPDLPPAQTEAVQWR